MAATELDPRAQGRTIVLGVGGGIAAYKACDLVRRLRAAGARVRVAMTIQAQRFVSALTFQALAGEPPLTDLMDPAQDAAFGHLALARGADLLIVAPATADLIGKLRAGLCDDPVTTVAVAARAPVLLCPAMNVAMWENRQVQGNLAALLADPRFRSCGPAAGLLADGDVGVGRLAEVPDIVETALALLGPRDLEGLKVLVTAGPTREPLDPVRFLSNPSSGRMGFALAQAARDRGAVVTLVTGPVEIPPPAGVRVCRVTTAEEMRAAALEALSGTELVLAAAAVSDFRPGTVASQKRKKGASDETDRLDLVRTPDVLQALVTAAAAATPRPVFVGFAAETEKLLEGGWQKLRTKKLDLVVANGVGPAGEAFGSESNTAVLLAEGEREESLPSLPKLVLAHRILDRVLAIRQRRQKR